MKFGLATKKIASALLIVSILAPVLARAQSQGGAGGPDAQGGGQPNNLQVGGQGGAGPETGGAGQGGSGAPENSGSVVTPGNCTALISYIADAAKAELIGDTQQAASQATEATDVLAVPVSNPSMESSLAVLAGTSVTHKEIANSKNFEDASVATLRCIGGILAQRLLDMIVDETIKWIQGDGEPKFVTNWEQFAADAANKGVGEVTQALGLGFLCGNFDLKVRLALESQTFENRATCTLDQIVGNIDSFYNNFLNGGWIAYAEMWQPQNNYFGAVLMVQEEASRRAAAKAEAAINEAISGQGYLAVKKSVGDLGGALITVPGHLVATLAGEDVVHPYRTLEAAIGLHQDSLEAYGSAIANAAFNRMIKEGVNGIQSLSTPNAPQKGYIASSGPCFGLTGNDRDTCLSLQNFDSLPAADKRSVLQSTINKETADLTSVITQGSSSIALLQQESGILASLFSCQSSKASVSATSTTQAKIDKTKYDITTIGQTIDKSNFLLTEIATINKNLQGQPTNDPALIEASISLNKYKDDRSGLLAGINAQSMLTQKNGIDLRLRQETFDLSQCANAGAASAKP